MPALAAHGVRFEQVCWDGGLRCRASQNERGSGTLDFGVIANHKGATCVAVLSFEDYLGHKIGLLRVARPVCRTLLPNPDPPRYN